jgi:hypothetical protein
MWASIAQCERSYGVRTAPNRDFDQVCVLGGALFPGFFAYFAIPYQTLRSDFTLHSACVKPHNDWQVDEFCHDSPRRHIPPR